MTTNLDIALFIEANHETMTFPELVKALGCSYSRVYQVAKKLDCFDRIRLARYVKDRPVHHNVAPGCFDVDSEENWLV